MTPRHHYCFIFIISAIFHKLVKFVSDERYWNKFTERSMRILTVVVVVVTVAVVVVAVVVVGIVVKVVVVVVVAATTTIAAASPPPPLPCHHCCCCHLCRCRCCSSCLLDYDCIRFYKYCITNRHKHTNLSTRL